MLPAASYGLPLESEISLVGLTEPGLRPLHRYRQSTDVDVLHLFAIGQQLYALSLQFLNAQALYLAELLHVVSPPLFWVTYTTLANLPQGRGAIFTQKG
jgi:hypothetical protein